MCKLIEEWKDIKGYEGLYQVSDWGRVKSLDWELVQKSKYGGQRVVKHKGRILKQVLNNKGYYYLRLSKNGMVAKKYIHRLVAEAFIPNPNNYNEVDHISGDTKNNKKCNLRWCTHRQNLSFPLAKLHISIRLKGKSNPQKAKMVDKISKSDGEVVEEYPSLTQAAQLNKCSTNGIWKCCKGIWSEWNNYIWKYHSK